MPTLGSPSNEAAVLTAAEQMLNGQNEMQRIMDAGWESTMETEKRVMQEVKDHMLSLPYAWREEMFGWMCSPFHEFFLDPPDGQGGWQQCCTSWCSVCVLLVLYGFGFSMFLLLLQSISICDENLVPESMLPTTPSGAEPASCAGWADQCWLLLGVLTLRGYVSYRIFAYVMLLVPFLYMPWVAIMRVKTLVPLVTQMLENVLNPSAEQLSASEQHVNEVRGKLNRMKDQNNITKFLESVSEHYNDSDDLCHRCYSVLLFFICHIGLGVTSLIFDGYAYTTMQQGGNGICMQLQERFNKMPSATLTQITTVSLYHLIIGTFYGIITLILIMSKMYSYVIGRREAKLQAALHKYQGSADTTRRRMAVADFSQDITRQRAQQQIENLRSTAELQAKLAAAQNENAGLRALYSQTQQQQQDPNYTI